MVKVKCERGEPGLPKYSEGGDDGGNAEVLGAADRRLLRSRYRELKTQVKDCKGQLAHSDFKDFKEIVDKAERLHKHVHKPREQVEDIELHNELTSELMMVAKGAQAKGGMSAVEFVGAIIHHFGSPDATEEEPGRCINWEALGLEACCILRHAPGMSTMVGPMDVELKPRKTVVRGRREKPTEKTRPETVEEVSADRPNTETDANMKTMFKILIQLEEVEVDRLILNRVSFAQTIENLFALSFLVKDGRVQIQFTEEGNQIVVPRNAPAHADRAGGEVLNTQFVFRMDFSCWKLMQEMVADGTEVMPHREKVDTAQISRTSRTPIRKHSRNRARETPVLSTPSEDGEDVSGEGGLRQRKRKLVDLM